MKVLVGEFYITAKLLNELITPLVLERHPSLRDLVFQVRDGSVHVTATGKYLLMRFTVTAVLGIVYFSFNGREHRLELEASYQVKPAYINLLIYGNPLEKILQEYPGVTVQGRRVTVELDRMAQFNLLKQIKLDESELLSLFEVTAGKFREHGLVFQVYLNPRTFPAD